MTETTVSPVIVVVNGMSEYHDRVLAGMRPGFAERRIPLLTVVNEPSATRRISGFVLDLVRREVPRGVVTLNAALNERSAQLRSELRGRGIPTVCLGLRCAEAPSVLGDGATGMAAVMAHLLDGRGVRRPALVRGGDELPDSVIREEVFRYELRRRGLPVPEELIVDSEFRYDVAYQAVRELLGLRPDLDAMVALNDESALGALDALDAAGLRVPEDVVLTGFDNIRAAELVWPGLTTVDPDLERQGAVAAALLLRLISRRDGTAGEAAGPGPAGTSDREDPQHVVVPSRLIIRGSTSRGPGPLAEELGDPVAMGKSARAVLASQEAVLGLNRALIPCRTVDHVVRALSAHLTRLGVRRCFLAVDETPGPAASGPGPDRPTRLLLAVRDGREFPSPPGRFARHRLLPPPLRAELDDGRLVLQPLSISGRDVGHLLFEPVPGPASLTEVLRIDLSRALDAVLRTRELEDHAATLERLVAERTRELERANTELQRSLMRDGLTRIANRTAFGEHLARHVDASGDCTGPMALLMVDVDAFKAFNDRYGHLGGDEALRTVAGCLEQAVREPEDLACRYGGEEFVVVLPRTGDRGAGVVAERFRDLLADAAVPHATSPVSRFVTASVGIAVVEAGDRVSSADLMRTADQALYRAKVLGRDRVVLARCGDHPPARVSDDPTPIEAGHPRGPGHG